MNDLPTCECGVEMRPQETATMSELTRYGLKWTANDAFVSVPMDDGYWTPWHIAADRISELEAKLAAAAAMGVDPARGTENNLKYFCKKYLQRRFCVRHCPCCRGGPDLRRTP